MSPKAKGGRDHGRGTLVLDRRFKGVGRLKVASGTKDARVFGMLNAMLTTLYDKGRIDLLTAIHKRTLLPMECWMRYREGDLERLQTADQAVTLAIVAARWIGRKSASAGHKRNLKAAFAALCAQRANATLADLPDLVRLYRVRCEAAGTPRVFNQAKAAARRLLRERVGNRSPLYLDVVGVPALTERRKPGHPQTVRAAMAVRDALGPAHGPIWWAMCLTGMGPGELWGQWEIAPEGIRIAGTKTATRDRVVPRIDFLRRPERDYRRFRIMLARHGLQPYDGRRTFAHWMEEAGVPRTRRRQYLGHTLGDVTDRYESHDVRPYLKADAERMRAYLAEQSHDISHDRLSVNAANS